MIYAVIVTVIDIVDWMFQLLIFAIVCIIIDMTVRYKSRNNVVDDKDNSNASNNLDKNLR